MSTAAPPRAGTDRPPRGSFVASARLQARVVRALVLRELITRFGRHNLGVLWLVVEPMLFTAGVAGLWSVTGMNLRSPVPVVAFAVTGYSSVLLWRNTVGHNLHAIRQNLALLFHRHVRLLDVFVARTLLEMGGATASFALLATVFTAAGAMAGPEDPLAVLGGWLLLAWFGGALSLLLGALSAFTEVLPRLWQPVSYVLFPLSGAAFMADWLPAAGREAVLWLPMVHTLEIVREGWFGAAVRTHHDAGYVALVSAGLTLAGLLVLRLAATRVENG